jgi:hypothetical protein
MALKERTIIDQISVDEFDNVSVRTRTDILRGKEIVSSSYHRHVIDAGTSLEGQDERVIRIATAARTPPGA